MKFSVCLLFASAAIVSATPVRDFDKPSIPNAPENAAHKKAIIREYAPFVHGKCVANTFYCSRHLRQNFPNWIKGSERKNAARVFFCQPGEDGARNEIVEYSVCDNSVEERWCEVFNSGKNFACWKKDMGKPLRSLMEQSRKSESRKMEDIWESTSGAANAAAKDIENDMIRMHE